MKRVSEFEFRLIKSRSEVAPYLLEAIQAGSALVPIPKDAPPNKIQSKRAQIYMLAKRCNLPCRIITRLEADGIRIEAYQIS